MADNKKYYYLKLKDNFFDTDEIIILESMQDGYLYSNILLKLYLRSLKYDGRLMFNERIPFNSTMLSQVTRHNVGVIEKAMQIFQELNLVEILDNGAIYMSDIQNFIGKSSTEGDRKRQYRRQIETEKNAKILLDGTNVQTNVGQTTTRDRDRDRVRVRDRVRGRDNNARAREEENQLPLPPLNSGYIKKYIDSIRPTASKFEIDQLTSYEEDGISGEVIELAIEEALLNNKPSLKYIKAILDRCLSEGILTAEQFKAKKEAYKSAKDKSNNAEVNENNSKYPIPFYTEEELSKLSDEELLAIDELEILESYCYDTCDMMILIKEKKKRGFQSTFLNS